MSDFVLSFLFEILYTEEKRREQHGLHIKTLQENLGHATAAFTLEVYGHMSRQMQINSANKLESFIQNVYAQPGLPSAVSF